MKNMSKRVWAINGYLLLVVLVALLWRIGADLLPSLGQELATIERGALVGEAAQVARQLESLPQHLTYDPPERIADSEYFLTSIYVMDKELPPPVQAALETAGDISRNMIGARVNVLIFSEDRREVNKLLDGFGYIHRVEYPRARRTAPQMATRPQHLLFEIATDDTNGDHRINEADRMAYYLSDFSGKNLRQITPDTLDLGRYWYTRDHQGLFFEEVKVGPEARVYGVTYTLDERRLYYYDLQTGQFAAFERLQQTFEEVLAAFQVGAAP